MGQIGYTTGIVLMGLFIMTVGFFIYDFAEENTPQISLTDDPVYKQTTGINSSLETYYDSQGSAAEAFYSGSLEGGSDETPSGGSFKVDKGTGFSAITKNTLNATQKTLFGGDSRFNIYLNAILFLGGLILALLIWKSIKSGIVE